MCTHVAYTMYMAVIHKQIPSYVDGISATMNSLPCWLDVDDSESPDSAKTFWQLV